MAGHSAAISDPVSHFLSAQAAHSSEALLSAAAFLTWGTLGQKRCKGLRISLVPGSGAGHDDWACQTTAVQKRNGSVRNSSVTTCKADTTHLRS